MTSSARSSRTSVPVPRQAPLDLAYLRAFCTTLFGDWLHDKRILSISNATAGVLQAASLGIAAIGAGYAALSGGQAQCGGKQVDRLLSNEGFDVDGLFEPWVKYVVGPRPQVVVALDWTDFEDDDHTTLCAYVVTDHGRATPLVWKTVLKSSLRTRRTGYEHALIERLHDLFPEAVDVTLLADRGFGDQALYALLEVLGWDYVIRFRSNILVEDEHGVQQTAAAWVGSGRAKKLPRARVTADRALVAAVVVVRAKGMKEPWCLATTLGGERASAIVQRYGKRFSIEETFRDEKDLHFGMGLSATHIGRADRRDRLLMLAALAHTLLTLLGEASEETGLDRTMRANAKKKRVLSLYHQGVYWFSAMGAMREEWFVRLMSAFDRLVAQHPFCREIFGIL